jgi:hypothetical protein
VIYFKAARISSLFAWTGLGSNLLAHSRHVLYGGVLHTAISVTPSSIATLMLGFFSLVFGLFSLSHNVKMRSEWLCFLWCASPLFILVYLLGSY